VFGTSNRATPTRFRELPVGLVRMNREIMEGRGTPELHALPGMCRAVASTPALPPPRGRVRSCRESARKPSASSRRGFQQPQRQHASTKARQQLGSAQPVLFPFIRASHAVNCQAIALFGSRAPGRRQPSSTGRHCAVDLW
jgi:hypothetical protein